MTTIELDASDLIVHVQGFDRLWSFKSTVRVSLANVVSAERAEAEARRWWLGLRAPGTHLPGVITAGTFYGRDGRAFFDVHDAKRAIVVRLQGDRYAKLVIEVADPDAAIAAVNAARASLGAGG